MTVLVAGLLVAALAGLGLFLDLRLVAYVEASAVTQLHQAADPIIARETIYHPARPGTQAADPPLLSRLAFDLAFQINGGETFAQVLAPDGTVVPTGPPPPGRAGLPVPRVPLDPATVTHAV